MFKNLILSLVLFVSAVSAQCTPAVSFWGILNSPNGPWFINYGTSDSSNTLKLTLDTFDDLFFDTNEISLFDSGPECSCSIQSITAITTVFNNVSNQYDTFNLGTIDSVFPFSFLGIDPFNYPYLDGFLMGTAQFTVNILCVDVFNNHTNHTVTINIEYRI